MSKPADRANPLSPGELVEALNELLEAERAGVKVAAAYRDDLGAGEARSLLDAVHTDEARSCQLLTSSLRRLGAQPSRRTGPFAERALGIDDPSDRLAFLNRGQRWVVRRLERMLPRIDDERIAAWLGEMLSLHVRNVLALEELVPCDR